MEHRCRRFRRGLVHQSFLRKIATTMSRVDQVVNLRQILAPVLFQLHPDTRKRSSAASSTTAVVHEEEKINLRGIQTLNTLLDLVQNGCNTGCTQTTQLQYHMTFYLYAPHERSSTSRTSDHSRQALSASLEDLDEELKRRKLQWNISIPASLYSTTIPPQQQQEWRRFADRCCHQFYADLSLHKPVPGPFVPWRSPSFFKPSHPMASTSSNSKNNITKNGNRPHHRQKKAVSPNNVAQRQLFQKFLQKDEDKADSCDFSSFENSKVLPNPVHTRSRQQQQRLLEQEQPLDHRYPIFCSLMQERLYLDPEFSPRQKQFVLTQCAEWFLRHVHDLELQRLVWNRVVICIEKHRFSEEPDVVRKDMSCLVLALSGKRLVSYVQKLDRFILEEEEEERQRLEEEQEVLIQWIRNHIRDFSKTFRGSKSDDF